VKGTFVSLVSLAGSVCVEALIVDGLFGINKD
jgi:hypothetical protein